MMAKKIKPRPLQRSRPPGKVRRKSKTTPIGRDGPPSPKGWRDALPIHPAAGPFPLMSPAELKELAEDIKKNGLFDLPKVWRADPDSPLELIDGRNRLDAMEIAFGPGTANAANTRTIGSSVDPYAYVIAANI